MWMKIKINLKWFHLLSKLKGVYRRFLEGVRGKHMRLTEDTLETHTSPNTIHSTPSLLRGIQVSGLKREGISSSHSSIPRSDRIITTTMRGGITGKSGGQELSGGDSSQVAHSGPKSANIRASSERLEMINSGKIVAENSGLTPAETREKEEECSHRNKIKRRLIEGALSLSVLGVKITSMLIHPFCGILTSCTESE